MADKKVEGTEAVPASPVEKTKSVVAATNAPTQKVVQFKQPDKKKHEYESVEPAGFKVVINEDKKSWTATGKGLSKTDAVNRSEAMQAVTDHVYPEQAIANATVKPNMINVKEKALFDAMRAAGKPVDDTDLMEPTKFDRATLMGMLANLTRKGFITLEPGGASLTDKGNLAIDSYQEKAVKVRVVKEREPVDPLARQRKMEEKYGKRPEGIGEPPTPLEYEEARLDNAEASLRFTLVLQRKHPYSPIIKKKLASCTTRLAEIRERIEQVKANGGKYLPSQASQKDAEAEAAEAGK